MKIIRIYLIENDLNTINKQIKLFENFNDIKIVGHSLSGDEAIKNIQRLVLLPQIIISEIWLKRLNAFELTRLIKKRYEAINFIIHTIFREKDYVFSAIKAGVSGYLLKGSSKEKLYTSIHEVQNGGMVIDASILKNLLLELSKNKDFDETPPFRNNQNLSLTNREIQCLLSISKGLNNQEAALSLKISLATMKTHLEHIYEKLEVKNRTEAVTKAIKQGIINT